MIAWWWALTAWAQDPSGRSASPDPSAGAATAAMCTPCHGDQGVSPDPERPHLAGQPAAYVAKELWDFRVGARRDPMMDGIAPTLEPAAIADLAAWFASLPAPAPVEGPPAKGVDLNAGASLYQRGAPARGLAPCRACHGARGEGGEDARGNGFPALAGQREPYLVKQLRGFHAAERSNDPGGMMSLIASRLTEADVTNVAAYLARLARTAPSTTASVSP